MNLHPKVATATIIAVVLIAAQVLLAMLSAYPDSEWVPPLSAGATALIALLGAYATPGGEKGAAVDAGKPPG